LLVLFNKVLDVVAILPQAFIDPISVIAVGKDVYQRFASIR
jgi:hypothetical protein